MIDEEVIRRAQLANLDPFDLDQAIKSHDLLVKGYDELAGIHYKYIRNESRVLWEVAEDMIGYWRHIRMDRGVGKRNRQKVK